MYRKVQGFFNTLISVQSDFWLSYCSQPFLTVQKELTERTDTWIVSDGFAESDLQKLQLHKIVFSLRIKIDWSVLERT